MEKRDRIVILSDRNGLTYARKQKLFARALEGVDGLFVIDLDHRESIVMATNNRRTFDEIGRSNSVVDSHCIIVANTKHREIECGALL